MFFSFSSEMIEATDVRGAIPMYMIAKSFVKNSSGISGTLMQFSIISVIAGNMTNWIRTVLFLSVSLSCFLKMINTLRILCLLIGIKSSSRQLDEHGLECRLRRMNSLYLALFHELFER